MLPLDDRIARVSTVSHVIRLVREGVVEDDAFSSTVLMADLLPLSPLPRGYGRVCNWIAVDLIRHLRRQLLRRGQLRVRGGFNCVFFG